MKESEIKEFANRLAQKLGTDLVGCKVGPGIKEYIKDIIIEEIKQFEKDKQLPLRDQSRSYEL